MLTIEMREKSRNVRRSLIVLCRMRREAARRGMRGVEGILVHYTVQRASPNNPRGPLFQIWPLHAILGAKNT